LKRVVVLVLVVVLCAGVWLSGCTQENAAMKPFVGSWQGWYSWVNVTHHAPADITFAANGTYHATLPLAVEYGTWTASDGVLTKTKQGASPVQFDAVFSENGTRLVLTSKGSSFEQWNITKK
jgi:hypothetical protein